VTRSAAAARATKPPIGELVPVARLATMASAYNPRSLDDHGMAALRRSMRQFGLALACCLAAGVPAAAELATVNAGVTVHADRDPVTQREPELREVGPRLDVVGVDVLHGAALLAASTVALNHSFLPPTQFDVQPPALGTERTAALPGRGARPNHVGLGAGHRAIPRAIGVDAELRLTSQAFSARGTATPAGAGTELRSLGAAGVLFVARSANRADERDARTSGENGFSFDGWHCESLSQRASYCDVIVQRWEAFTGKKAKRPRRSR